MNVSYQRKISSERKKYTRYLDKNLLRLSKGRSRVFEMILFNDDLQSIMVREIQERQAEWKARVQKIYK